MTKYSPPYFIEFSKIGNSTVGYISVAENLKSIPFEIKRVFWTYFTPEELTRGHHAHYKTQQILLAVAGKIIVHTELPDGTKNIYTLDKPHLGIYLPLIAGIIWNIPILLCNWYWQVNFTTKTITLEIIQNIKKYTYEKEK